MKERKNVSTDVSKCFYQILVHQNTRFCFQCTVCYAHKNKCLSVPCIIAHDIDFKSQLPIFN